LIATFPKMELPTAEAIRAARAGVDKSLPVMSKAADIGVSTWRRAEDGWGVPSLKINTLQKIVSTLAAHGAVIDHQGRVSFSRRAA
jgi:hypothetical protein